MKNFQICAKSGRLEAVFIKCIETAVKFILIFYWNKDRFQFEFLCSGRNFRFLFFRSFFYVHLFPLTVISKYLRYKKIILFENKNKTIVGMNYYKTNCYYSFQKRQLGQKEKYSCFRKCSLT